MESDTNVEIYIDNFGDEEDEAFAVLLKKRLLGLKINAKYRVSLFRELDFQPDPDDDPDNEINTVRAINQADIVIPIMSAGYISYVTPRVEKTLNKVIESKHRYFFPILLKEFDWSNYEWIVKSQLTPQNALPFLNQSDSDRERIVNELIKHIGVAILDLIGKHEGTEEAGHAQILKNGETIFISHGHDDADFAELLKLKLEREGINSWLDMERLKIGQDWREEIDQGIENSAAVIAIMTPDARKSEYVTYEWAFAWGKGKKIFPLMLKQTQLHPRLESLQYLNFTNNPTRPWNELIDSIKKILV